MGKLGMSPSSEDFLLFTETFLLMHLNTCRIKPSLGSFSTDKSSSQNLLQMEQPPECEPLSKGAPPQPIWAGQEQRVQVTCRCHHTASRQPHSKLRAPEPWQPSDRRAGAQHTHTASPEPMEKKEAWHYAERGENAHQKKRIRLGRSLVVHHLVTRGTKGFMACKQDSNVLNHLKTNAMQSFQISKWPVVLKLYSHAQI